MRSRLPRLSGGVLVFVGVRAVLAGLGVAALLVPLASFTGPAAGLAVVCLPLALFTAWRPGGPWATALLVVAAVVWVITSLFEGRPPVLLTAGFGCLVYLVHGTAAFAAMLPLTSRVEPVLLARWLARTGAVLVASVPLMLGVLLAPALPGSPLLALAGVLAALGLSALLVVLLHRRPAG